MTNYDFTILEMLGCINEDLDIDKIEKKFVDLVGELLSFDRIALFFVKHKKELLQGKLSKGFDPDVIRNLEIPIQGNSVLIKPLITGVPLMGNQEKGDGYTVLLNLTDFALIPIVNRKRMACWEIKDCGITNCPAFGKKWLRCWLVRDTKCAQHAGRDAEGTAQRCSTCPIFVDLNFETVEGIMLVDNSISRRPITDESITILLLIAHTVSTAINNSKLYMKTLDVAIRDPLTNLHNRRYFNERLLDEVESARKYAEPLSLIICDIDHFKCVNDTYGHPAGDSVLCRLADIFRKTLRKNDVTARYGGEEFSILLLNTAREEALNIAEKIRRSVEDEQFKVSDEFIAVTLSFGVAALGTDSNTFEGLVSNADKALYHAKTSGRNKVCTCY